MDTLSLEPCICYTQIVGTTELDKPTAVVVGDAVQYDWTGDLQEVFLGTLFTNGSIGVREDEGDVMWWDVIHQILEFVVEPVFAFLICKFCRCLCNYN